jgi:hypothetical protein
MHVNDPNGTVILRMVDHREIRRHEGRHRPIEQTSRTAVVLHEGPPVDDGGRGSEDVGGYVQMGMRAELIQCLPFDFQHLLCALYHAWDDTKQ